MADTENSLKQAYSAFNNRDIDGALALMTQGVIWSKASEGGRIAGKKRSALIGLDNGKSSIPMSNRLQSLWKTEARPASGCINSLKAFKGRFSQTARFCVYWP